MMLQGQCLIEHRLASKLQKYVATRAAAIDGSDLFVKSYSARLITTTVPGRQPAARTVSR